MNTSDSAQRAAPRAGVIVLAATLGSLGLVACNRNGHRGSRGSTAAASTRPTAAPRRQTPPIKLELGDSTRRSGPSVRTDWGSCSAGDREGDLVVSCYSSHPLEIHAQAKGVAEVVEKQQQGRLTRAGVSLLPAVLAVLADTKVPAPQRSYGGHVGPVDLASNVGVHSPTVTVNPEARFTVKLAGEVTHGTIAPFQRTLSDLLLHQLPRIAPLAAKGLLFPGETPGAAAPAAHSVLYISAGSFFDVVSRKEDMAYSLFVLGPAQRVRDADWLATEQSTFADAGKKCGGYRAKSGPDKGKVMSLPLFVEHKAVVLRERRTGKEIGRKSFEAPGHCPTGFDFTQEKKVRSLVGSAKVESWLRDEIKKAH